MTKMNIINRPLATLIVAAMATYAATASYSWAQTPANLPVIKTQFQEVQATVQAIDPATRKVSLRGASGQFSVVVGNEVKNFANMHVGDKVVVSYYQGLAVQMARGDVKATEPAASTFDYRASSGQKPGGGVGASITETVTIAAIDKDTNSVAFTTSDGAVHLVAAKSPNMVTFVRTLKPGDKVDITYTESLAVKVVPATGG
jgi:hypothetical protein